MAAGLLLGALIPGLNGQLDRLQVGTVSLPIAAGLLLMMYPVLAKVRYEDIGRMSDDGVGNWRFWNVAPSVWVVGPALMFALAWIFLADQPAYRTGVIIVGLARCIAMVLVWNDIALGDRERAAVPGRLQRSLPGRRVRASRLLLLDDAARLAGLRHSGLRSGDLGGRAHGACLLGIPLAAGFITRRVGIRRRGRDWYEQRFIPRIAPLTLYGLLFTIVLLFAIQGDQITSEPLDVALIAVPLLVYFAVMWVLGFASGRVLGFPYPQTAALAFTVASNDFELRSRYLSGSLAPRQARLSRGSLAHLSRCRSLSGSSTLRCGSGEGSVGPSLADAGNALTVRHPGQLHALVIRPLT